MAILRKGARYSYCSVVLWNALSLSARRPQIDLGVAKFTRSEERGCGFVLGKFQQARTARICTLALLLNDLETDSSLLPSLFPSLK